MVKHRYKGRRGRHSPASGVGRKSKDKTTESAHFLVAEKREVEKNTDFETSVSLVSVKIRLITGFRNSEQNNQSYRNMNG